MLDKAEHRHRAAEKRHQPRARAGDEVRGHRATKHMNRIVKIRETKQRGVKIDSAVMGIASLVKIRVRPVHEEGHPVLVGSSASSGRRGVRDT